MKTKKEIISQFEYLEQLLLTEGNKMSEEAYRFNVGGLASLAIVLATKRNHSYEVRYADCKNTVDALRRERIVTYI